MTWKGPAKTCEPIRDGQQLCSRCGQWKPVEEFNRDSRYPSGLRRWCRECGNAYNTQWRASPPRFPAGREGDCGHILNTWNPGPLCFPCEDKAKRLSEAESTMKRRKEVQMAEE